MGHILQSGQKLVKSKLIVINVWHQDLRPLLTLEKNFNRILQKQCKIKYFIITHNSNWSRFSITGFAIPGFDNTYSILNDVVLLDFLYPVFAIHIIKNLIEKNP